jgi:uncharacterized protein YbdZ (MbtH family)
MSTRRSGEPVSINPIDDDNGSFFVLVNGEEQHGLWPTFADAACLDYTEQNWTGRRLQRLAEGRAVDK